MRVIDIQLQDCGRGDGEILHRGPLRIGEECTHCVRAETQPDSRKFEVRNMISLYPKHNIMRSLPETRTSASHKVRRSSTFPIEGVKRSLLVPCTKVLRKRKAVMRLTRR